MALIKYGGGILDARGSIGGQVHSRNRYGAYIKARVKPVNPNSVLQSAIRTIIAFVAQLYRSATSAAQKADWAIFASNVPATNKLGEVINLSGYNQFVKSNTAAINAGLPQILDGPSVFTLPGEDPTFAAAISEATQTIACTFDAARDWAGEDDAGLIVQMGLPQDDSIGFFNGPWRHAGVVLGDGITPPVTGDTVACPFNVVALQKVWVRAKIIRADGRLSGWFRFTALAGA